MGWNCGSGHIFHADYRALAQACGVSRLNGNRLFMLFAKLPVYTSHLARPQIPVYLLSYFALFTHRLSLRSKVSLDTYEQDKLTQHNPSIICTNH